MTEFIVSQEKYADICDADNTYNIGEKNRISDSVFLHNREYVITGGKGNGKGTGWDYKEGYEILDTRRYSGELMPMSYKGHFEAVNAGLRPRSYVGLELYYKNRTVVCIAPVRFKAAEKTSQLEMF